MGKRHTGQHPSAPRLRRALLAIAVGLPMGAQAAIATGSAAVAVLDCNGQTATLGQLAVKSEARETLTGYQVTTTAGLRLDARQLPACLKELDFINVLLTDPAPPSWTDEGGNTHPLAVPFIDPPWKWKSGDLPAADTLPAYDGQARDLKASQAGGRAGAGFALDDLLKIADNADPTLAIVFGDMPRTNASIKFATLLTSVDATSKKLGVIESFTWGASISRDGGNTVLATLPITLFGGLPAGLDRSKLQAALDASGFGADIKAADGSLQHTGEGWTVSAAADCTPCRPVPEPSGGGLLLAGAAALGLYRSMRRAAPG